MENLENISVYENNNFAFINNNSLSLDISKI